MQLAVVIGGGNLLRGAQFSALAAANDLMAFGALTTLQAHGIGVPGGERLARRRGYRGQFTFSSRDLPVRLSTMPRTTAKLEAK